MSAPLVFIYGADDYSVQNCAKARFESWRLEAGDDAEIEIVDGAATAASEAARSLGQVREALATLPFFGGEKLVWWKGVVFMDDRHRAATKDVMESLAQWVGDLESFSWQGVRLLISAGKVDKRRGYFKKLKSIAESEGFDGWSIDDRNWRERAEAFLRKELDSRRIRIGAEALTVAVDSVGPDPRGLAQEAEKLALFVGSREQATVEDVEAIVTHNKQARAFAMSDALGDRDARRTMELLDQELWSVKNDSSKSEIGLLYGLIYKMRAMLLAKALVGSGLLRPGGRYPEFQKALKSIPKEKMPDDKRFDPTAMSPFVLFRAVAQCGRYQESELMEAMRILLDTNRRMVSSGQDPGGALKHAALCILNRS